HQTTSRLRTIEPVERRIRPESHRDRNLIVSRRDCVPPRVRNEERVTCFHHGSIGLGIQKPIKPREVDVKEAYRGEVTGPDAGVEAIVVSLVRRMKNDLLAPAHLTHERI